MTSNTAASVRARLTNQAQASHRPFQEILLSACAHRLAQIHNRPRQPSRAGVA